MRPARSEIRALTGLRGYAALLIALYHFGNPALNVATPLRFHLTGAYLVVDAFFMMSGFVLSYNYWERFRSGIRRAPYLDFILRRIARLYPAYIAVTAILFLKLLLNMRGMNALQSFTWWDGVGNLFMLTGWGLNVRPLVGPSWSVSAELLCYFLFPFLLMVASVARWRPLYSLALVAGGVLLMALAGNGAEGSLDLVAPDTAWPMFRAFCGFLAGIALFQLDQRHGERLHRLGDLLMIVALLAITATWIAGLDDAFKYPAIGILVLALSQDTSLARRVFANRLAYFLGEISYSVYLAHQLCMVPAYPIARVFAPRLGLLPAYALALSAYVVFVVVMAAIFYRLFELRGKVLMTGWLQRMTGAPRTARPAVG